MYKIFFLIPCLCLAGCGARNPAGARPEPVPADSIRLTSPAFANNAPIPEEYSFNQENYSPPLAWAQVPAGTKELALLAADPDATTPEPLVHWLVYKIPPTMTGLPARVARAPDLVGGLRQGTNSFGTVGYAGPALARHAGTHHYRFTLYALSQKLDLDGTATAAEFRSALGNHVLATGTLIGTFTN